MLPKSCVIDVVDLSDQAGAYWKDCLDGHNTTTIALGGMSNAIDKMVDMIFMAAGGKRVIRCLAFWGHGAVDQDENPLGIHLISGGWDAQFNRSAFTTPIMSTMRQSLLRLKPCFQADARVELRGCGAAATATGIEAMRMLATLWGVPVQAAKKNQPTMSWLPPVVEVSPTGAVRGIQGIEYNLRT